MNAMVPTLIRQRPGIGDALLLSALIRKLGKVDVVTDNSYSNGALTAVFKANPHVRIVTDCDPSVRTTESNKAVDPRFQNAELIRSGLDCNGGFMMYERDHKGDPPLGIAAYWLSHFNFPLPENPADLRPDFKINNDALSQADDALSKAKPILGIVLRAGDPVRNWNYNNRAGLIADWAHSRGLTPITIDPYYGDVSQYAQSFRTSDVQFTAALIARCKLLVTPDTGLLHLAEAVGTPTVSVWGKVRPELRVRGYNTRIVPRVPIPACEPDEHCPCCSWRFQHYSCLRKLAPGAIIDAIEEAL